VIFPSGILLVSLFVCIKFGALASFACMLLGWIALVPRDVKDRTLIGPLSFLVSCSSILAILQRHQGNMPMTKASLLELRRISGGSSGPVELVRNGGVDALVQLTQQYKTNQEVVAGAMAALANIAARDECREALTKHLPYLLEMLKDQGCPPEVATQVLRTIRNTSALGNNALTLVAPGGGLETILSTMLYQRSVEAVQAHGAACLWNMAITDVARAQIVGRGGEEALKVAVAEWPKSPEVQAIAEAAMRAIELHEPSRLTQSLRC